MPKLSPEEGAAKWSQRTQAAVPDYQAAVRRVTESPMAKAAAAEDKWAAGVTRAKTEGKYKRGLLRVPLAEWQEKTAVVGGARIADGVVNAEEKMAKANQKLYAYEETLQKKVNGMQKVTRQDSVNRAVAWINGMMDYDKTK